MAQFKINPHYIIDMIALYHLSTQEKEDLFYDSAHLKKKGHDLWAKIIFFELERQIYHSY